jgi:hypothetical protein
MREKLQSDPTTKASEELPAPQGIGTAVAFDWGLTVELLLLPILPFILGVPNPYNLHGLNRVLSTIITTAILWIIAIMFGIFGEGVRRGWRWTRPIQFVGNALGFIGGFFLLPGALKSIQAGDYLALVPAFILLFVSPVIAWRLSRPATVQWFAKVNSTQARKRHGGKWVWFILLWSVVGGVLVALGVYK